MKIENGKLNLNTGTARVLISHAGKQHSYHVAKNLLELGVLQKFITSSYVSSETMQKFFISTGNKFFGKRFLEGLHSPFVESHWKYELKEYLYRKLNGRNRSFEQLVYERDRSFDEMVALSIYRLKPDVFWGFQGSCRDTLMACKEQGIFSFCELATAHVTSSIQILEEESRLQPEWADSINNLFFPPFAQKRLEEEPFLADKVVAASQFTRQTLLSAGLQESKIIQLPLGFDLSHIKYVPKNDGISNRPLKLLYAGTVTQRKGMSYLLEAIKFFKRQDVQLTIYGNIEGKGDAFKKHLNDVNYCGPISQTDLFQKYHEYDALVLPTIFEGFGLVIVEALAAGLPVITTDHSIGPDAIVQNQNGRIVPIRDIEAIRSAISRMRSWTDTEFLSASLAARHSAMAFTWERHRLLLKKILSED